MRNLFYLFTVLAVMFVVFSSAQAVVPDDVDPQAIIQQRLEMQAEFKKNIPDQGMYSYEERVRRVQLENERVKTQNLERQKEQDKVRHLKTEPVTQTKSSSFVFRKLIPFAGIVLILMFLYRALKKEDTSPSKGGV